MNLKYFTTLAIAVLFTFGLTGCNSSNDRKIPNSDLRLKLKVGEVYTLQATIDQDITQEIPQAPVLKFHQMLQMGLNCAVASIDADANYNMEITYKSLAYKITGLPEPIEFDSNGADNKNFPLADIVGKTYQLTMSPIGKVLDVKGADLLVDNLVDNMTAPPEVKAVLSKEALKNQFGDKATQEMMNSLISSFPEQPIKQGEHWLQEFSIQYGYPVRLHIDYTLLAVSDNQAALDVKISRMPLADAPKMTVGDITFSYQLKGEDTGKIHLDLRSGWINDGKIDSELSGKVIVAPTQDLPEGLAWPIHIVGTVVLQGQGPLLDK